MKALKDYVTTIPDFPQKGIMFRDITSVIDDADGLQLAIDSMQDLVKDLDFDVVVGAESRGFVFGTPIAYNMHKPMVLIRKKGKLPRETVEVSYDLEYGQATLEMHKDSIKPGQKVLIVDDLMATGGTAKENAEICRRILSGRDRGPKRDAVLINAGAALYMAGKENSIKEGVELAAHTIDCGAAFEKMDQFISATNQ